MRGQRNAVFNHLVKHGDLTSKQAFELYGCTRLAALIHDFRQMGYDIITIDEYGNNRYGENTRYARYIMSVEERAKWQNQLK